MNLELSGKAGIVTGASRGIGAAIVAELIGEGARVALAARESDALREQVARHRAESVAVCPGDLRAPDTAAEIVAAAVARFGRLDFVVANAGATKAGDLLELTDADWADGFATKFFGHVRLVRAAWPHLRAAGGSIVLIAGVTGRTPPASGIMIGAVNSALLNLSKSLAAKGFDEGVQVNAINPGPIRTARFAGRVANASRRLGVDAAEAERHLLLESGSFRIGEPEDIAGVVCFLLSARGSYLRGAVIDVDGGKTRTL
jgi:3-oxoacyl-[acyl-carrier protein] reductase